MYLSTYACMYLSIYVCIYLHITKHAHTSTPFRLMIRIGFLPLGLTSAGVRSIPAADIMHVYMYVCMYMYVYVCICMHWA